MASNEYKQSLIRQFISRSLSPKQLTEMEAEIANDEMFAKEVAFQIALSKVVKKQATAKGKLSEEIQDIIHNNQQQTKGSYQILQHRSLIAASITALCLLLATVLWSTKDKREMATISTIELDQLTANIQPNNKLGSIDDFYQHLLTKDYKQAIFDGQQIKDGFKDKCLNDIINDKLGRLYLYYAPARDYEAAIHSLECIYTLYYPARYKETPIHLARAYAWSGDLERAKQLIQTTKINPPADLKKLLVD